MGVISRISGLLWTGRVNWNDPVNTSVYNNPLFIRCAIPKLYTFFTQVENRGLSIKFLPYSRHLFTNNEIKLDGLFNLFNRVNRGGVVFTAQFTSDLWEAEM